ncbi:MAG: sigma-70 family RNA polymerase sigma factor [Phycisphaerales bacterium]|nr:MAG: sigma-70 family RNA polymerase sigma factor [Phycisphaerales bacterium]
MPSEDVTSILSDLIAGDERAADALMAAAYAELRALAEHKLKYERPGHLLQPTALVHEAYLRLVDQTRVDWKGRTHFHAVAAQAMRRVLIDHARRRNREKRSGRWRKVTLDDAFAIGGDHELDVIALHEALEMMRLLDERQVEVIELRIFGGLNTDEVAQQLRISTRTVERDWKMGLAWLRRELSSEE